MKGNVMITLLISIPFSIVFIGALVFFWYRHHITNDVTRHRVRLQLFRHISRERLQNQDVERGGLYYGPPMPKYTQNGWMRPSRRHYGEPVELEYLNRHCIYRDPSRHRAQECRRAGAPHSSPSAEQEQGKPVKTGQKKGKANQDNNKQNNENEGREPPRNKKKKKKKNQKANNDNDNEDKDTNNENTQNSSQQRQQEQTKKNNSNRRQSQTRDQPSKKKQKDQGAETSWGNQSRNNDDQDQPQNDSWGNNDNQQQDQADTKKSRRQNRGQKKPTRQKCEEKAPEEGWGNHSQNDDSHGQSQNENEGWGGQSQENHDQNQSHNETGAWGANENEGWGTNENEDWKGQNNHDQEQSQNDNWGTDDNQQPGKAPEKEDWDGNGSEQGGWGQQAERNDAMDNTKNNDGW